MLFYNREREIKELKAILSGEPNLVYFVYGTVRLQSRLLWHAVRDVVGKE